MHVNPAPPPFAFAPQNPPSTFTERSKGRHGCVLEQAHPRIHRSLNAFEGWKAYFKNPKYTTTGYYWSPGPASKIIRY
jgi:hypothetical protein